jgi:methionine synthase II (cobalamin-independent)
MISASMGGMIWDRERSSAVYPAPNNLIEDLAALQIDEIGGLAARGVRWVQLDSLKLPQLLDGAGRLRAGRRTAVQRGARRQVPARVRHGAGRRLRAAALRPARADGGPRPGHHQVPQLETRDDLLRRIDEAARYAPLEQLALSPQCGFASGSLGNLITVDDERRKLDLVVSVAGQVWG